MDESFIQKALESRFSNHKYHLFNSYIFKRDWESDYFSVTQSKYTYEVEIKISKQDFKSDFNKAKHRLFKDFKKQFSIYKEGESNIYYEVANNKYERTKCTDIQLINMHDAVIPNKFYFACPEGLLDINDIPEYAGLIQIQTWESGSLKNTIIKKEAPFLHKRILNLDNVLKEKFYWRSKKLEFDNYHLNQELKKLKLKLNIEKV